MNSTGKKSIIRIKEVLSICKLPIKYESIILVAPLLNFNNPKSRRHNHNELKRYRNKLWRIRKQATCFFIQPFFSSWSSADVCEGDRENNLSWFWFMSLKKK